MLDEATWHAWLDFLETQGITSRALLQGPAIDNDFTAIEAVIGRPLPEALKVLYRFSNGQLRSGRDGISFRHDDGAKLHKADYRQPCGAEVTHRHISLRVAHRTNCSCGERALVGGHPAPPSDT